MHHKSEPDDVNELQKLGYDRRDVGLKPLAIGVVGFFLFTVLSAVVIVPMYNYFIGSIYAGDTPEAIQRRWEVPQPPLQDRITAVQDLHKLRQHENETLSTTGPSPENPGRGRIPISEAIDLTAERGLDAPAPAPTPEENR